MKKLLCLLLALGFCLTLCACGEKVKSISVGETHTVGDISFKVSRIRYAPVITQFKEARMAFGYYTHFSFEFDQILQPTTNAVEGLDLIADSGRTFMIIDFEVKSTGQTELHSGDFQMELNFNGKQTFDVYGEYYEGDSNVIGENCCHGVSLEWYEGHQYRSYAECYTQVQTDTSAKVWLDVTINGESFKVNINN